MYIHRLPSFLKLKSLTLDGRTTRAARPLREQRAENERNKNNSREPLALRVRHSKIYARPQRHRRQHDKKFRGAPELTTAIADELRGGIPFAIAFPLKVNPGQEARCGSWEKQTT